METQDYTQLNTVLRSVIYFFIIVALAAAAWFVFPYILQTQLRTATIYFSAPLTLESNKTMLNGFTVALEENNYKAGKISLLLSSFDDGDSTGTWLPEKERNIAELAAADETAVAYIGPANSGAAKISMPILNTAGILQISPSNTWPGLTKVGFLPGEPGIFYPTGIRHYVRVCTTDDLQGPAAAVWAHKMGYKSVYVVNDADPYGVGIANLFQAEARRLGMTVFGQKTVSAKAAVYQSLADDIVISKAELVYYGGTTPNGGPELIKTLRQRGSPVAFMGPDGVYEQDFIDKIGSSTDSIFITAVGAPPEEVKTKNSAEFLRKYTARFHTKPDVFAALAYDAAVALIRSIERADAVDRRAVLTEMKNIKSFNGVFGLWGFDQNGDTTQTLLSGNTVKNGAFVFERLLTIE